MSEPVWIRKDVVLAIHQRQIAEHGGEAALRDEGLLDSALDRPKNRYAYQEPAPAIEELASAYAFAISRNHPFVDGNKRTAFVVCLLFLSMNGLSLNAEQEEMYRVFLDLAAGKMSEEELTDWLKKALTQS